tara:strand:- start:81 stop:974 length:894 start_codon:yes stop_codon:yes gene_type:complete
MKNIIVVGHIVLDTLFSNLKKTNLIGGPPSYTGLTVRKLGAEVTLLTKYGKDLSNEYLFWFTQNQINIPNAALSTTHSTTHFNIIQTAESRNLQLKARCEDIKCVGEDIKGNAAILSPVAGEIRSSILSNLRNKFETVYLDPQGFIRRFKHNGECFLDKIDKKVLKYTDIIKMDQEEAYYITGSRDPFKSLQKTFESGVKVSIYTRGSKDVLLRCNEGLFKIPVVKNVKILDITGVGDIFAGAFTFTYLQDKDPIWAGSMATASSSVHLDRLGVLKIPEIDDVVNVAEDIFGRTERI